MTVISGVGAVVGAGAGGLIGSLTHAGVSEDDAHVYAEGVRRGGSLVSVTADEDRAAEADRILNSRSFVDPAQRRADYRAAGWTRFDEAAGPYEPTRSTAAGEIDRTGRTTL